MSKEGRLTFKGRGSEWGCSCEENHIAVSLAGWGGPHLQAVGKTSKCKISVAPGPPALQAALMVASSVPPALSSDLDTHAADVARQGGRGQRPIAFGIIRTQLEDKFANVF